MPDLDKLLTWPVGLYIGVVLLAQIGLAYHRKHQELATTQKRQKAGLDDKVLVDHAVKLETLQRHAITDALVLLLTVFIFPLFLVAVLGETAEGLGATFVGLLIWALISATDVAKAFLGGITFRALVAFKQPFQIGDRVALNGHSGKIVDIGPFFLRLNTVDDDLVSIPTYSLWNQTLVSANAGDRSSLCKMEFYLSPKVTAEQRKQTEDAIWNAIQKSVYWDFGKPMQIYVEQRRHEIVLTARAYVASTYNEPLFRSDVYQEVLDFMDQSAIPLSTGGFQHIDNE